MPHHLHVCSNTPDNLIESLQRIHNWPYEDKIPLNSDAGGHEDAGCPYCGKPIAEMERATGRDAALLKMKPRGWAK